MALDFYLVLDTDRSSKAVFEQFRKECGLDDESESQWWYPDDLYKFSAPGAIVAISPVTALEVLLTKEKYKITPEISVSFRIDKFDEHSAGMDTMYASVFCMMIDDPGDLVFGYKDHTDMIRKDGVVYLHRGSEEWDPKYGDQTRNIPFEYEWADIRQP